jgi:uncharacterized protein (DUF362 family)
MTATRVVALRPDPSAALRDAVALALGARPAPAAVLVKVNLCAASRYGPASGVWVPPQKTAAVVEGIRAAWPTTEVLVGESDSVGGLRAVEKFAAAGYDQVLARHECALVALDQVATVGVGVGSRDARLPRLATETPVISLTKAKTHNIAGFTGATKNLFGLYVGDKSLLHPYLLRALAEVVRRVDVVLAVADADPGLQGDGPCRGEPLPLDLAYVGPDPVALDAAVAMAWGIAGLVLPVDDATEMSALPAVAGVTQPPREQRSYVRTGLRIQAAAGLVDRFGHAVHDARTWRDLRKAPGALRRLLGGRR